jgi:hypothetical protein
LPTRLAFKTGGIGAEVLFPSELKVVGSRNGQMNEEYVITKAVKGFKYGRRPSDEVMDERARRVDSAIHLDEVNRHQEARQREICCNEGRTHAGRCFGLTVLASRAATRFCEQILLGGADRVCNRQGFDFGVEAADGGEVRQDRRVAGIDGALEVVEPEVDEARHHVAGEILFQEREGLTDRPVLEESLSGVFIIP